MKIRAILLLSFLLVAPAFCLAQSQEVLNQARKEGEVDSLHDDDRGRLRAFRQSF